MYQEKEKHKNRLFALTTGNACFSPQIEIRLSLKIVFGYIDFYKA
jgi:hypothetical protein